jgi:hypothetical protein
MHLLTKTLFSKQYGSPTFELFRLAWFNPDSLGPELSQLSPAVSMTPTFTYGPSYLKTDLEKEEKETWKKIVLQYQSLGEADVARNIGKVEAIGM